MDKSVMGDFFFKLNSGRVAKKNVKEVEIKSNKMWLNLGENLLGYRIKCKGMFTRRHTNRSKTYTVYRGRASISSCDDDIEYSAYNITLRSGSCGIHVWLLKRTRLNFLDDLKYDYKKLEAEKSKI